MKTIYNQLNRIFVTDPFLKKISGKDKLYARETISHIGFLKENSNFYAFSHETQKGLVIVKPLNNSLVRLHKRPISFEKNLRNENKPQFISGPGFNFENYLDLQAIEIFRHINANKFESIDRFFKEYEYTIMKTIEEIDENDGIIFLEEGELRIKKIHHFDKLD